MTPSSDDALLPLEAVRPAQSSKDTKGAPVPAPENPVARVVVDSPLPHLDRPFDYLVPGTMHETAEPGVRVRVRFAGKLVDGFLLERVPESEHEGRLTPLERVVSPERVLTPEIAGLARAVADRYAGTLTDVLRLAVPPRHAKAESEPRKTDPPADSQDQDTSESPPPAPSPSAWDAYPTGSSFLDALRDGRAPRAVWSALPGARGWAGAVAEAVRATLDGGRGAVVVVPDGKDVALADAEFGRLLGPGRHVALTADLGPAERYRRWLRVLRGEVRAVVGTRAAMFAPVAELGLVAIWDDGDDLHAERLAPYPHAREVLGLRAHRTGAGLLIGGYARTAEATQLVASGWARPIVAARTTIRTLAPRVRPAGEDAELAKDQAARQARLPSIAWRALRLGLESGPVLVQVPRRGYLPALACRHCRAPARCVLPPPAPALAFLGRRTRTRNRARKPVSPGRAGADRAGYPGARPSCCGPAGCGPAGCGPAGCGPAGCGPAGCGPAGCGPAGCGPAGWAGAAVSWAAGAQGWPRGPVLPVVRPGGRRLAVPVLRQPAPAGRRHRRQAYGGGARPGLPLRAGADLGT
ncbi:hypothetical protein ACFQQB_47390 [Nonomuraea rubra]|uniref:primosomal protein N' family DNA-binding protein n=1 Tax=Nonomuraea rubra TaxID=46180 RepID=UPI0036191E13